MADSKITDLTALTTAADDDLLVAVDVSDTTMGATGSDKQIAVSDLVGGKEDVSNKSTDDTLADDSDTEYPSQSAVKGYVDTATGLLVPKSLVDAKGDLLVGTADNTVARRAVGTDGQVLAADSTDSTGVKWATPSIRAIAEAGLKVIRGTINTAGTVAAGSGWSVSKTATGTYTVTFTVAFSAPPSVAVAPVRASGAQSTAQLGAQPLAASFQIVTLTAGSLADRDLCFIAIGPA